MFITSASWILDRELSQQACELRRLSELVRHAYDRPPKIDQYGKIPPCRLGLLGRGLVASLLLGLGGLLGWTIHQPDEVPAASTLSAMYWDDHNAFQNTDISKVTAQQGAKRIIVHLNTSSASKFEKALDTAEQLLEAYDDTRSTATLPQPDVPGLPGCHRSYT